MTKPKLTDQQKLDSFNDMYEALEYFFNLYDCEGNTANDMWHPLEQMRKALSKAEGKG